MHPASIDIRRITLGMDIDLGEEKMAERVGFEPTVPIFVGTIA